MINKGRNMNVNSISNFVEKHIASLGIKKNDNVVVHADITSFGIFHKKLLSIIIRGLMKKKLALMEQLPFLYIIQL